MAGTSSKGLYYYNPATSQHGEFKLDTVNTSRTINNIYEDRKNNLWFATGDGIKIYDRSTQQTTKYDMQDGLPSNVIYRIEEDKKETCGSVRLTASQDSTLKTIK